MLRKIGGMVILGCALAPASGRAQGSWTAGQGAAASNGMSQGISQGIGQSLLSQGTSEMPQCQQQQCSCCADALMKILMGLMGLAQAGANGGTQGSQLAQGTQFQDYQTPTDTSAPPVPVEIAKIRSATAVNLSKFGVKLDPKSLKVTLPNGSSFGPSDIMDPAAMAKAGVSGSEYAANMALAKSLEAKAAKELASTLNSKPTGFESGGGGGGGGGYASAYKSPKEEVVAPGERKPAALPELSGNVKLGPIMGSSEQNIFTMMSKRYQEKTRGEAFLPPESTPEAPAPPKI